MNKRTPARIVFAIVAAFLLTASACSGTDGTSSSTATSTTAAVVAGGGSTSSTTATTSTASTTAPTSTTQATTTTTQAAATSTSAAATTTTAGAVDVEVDCLNYWSEDLVQTILGDEYTFSDKSVEGTACSFTAIPNSVTVFFRLGGRTEFNRARAGADSIGGSEELEDVCDDGFFTDVAGIVAAEGLSNSQGLIFNATVLGHPDPVAVAGALLQAACDGPSF